MGIGHLLDLPPDCTLAVFTRAVFSPRNSSPVGAVRTLRSLGATCRRFHSEANEIADWARLWEQWALPLGCKIRGLPDVCAEIARWARYAHCLELPSVQQAVACVVRSATAHSYYKHLNIGRSACFSFSLSLVAGMRETQEGHYVEYVRGDGTEFHYTWTPTAEYRERFGLLDYEDGASRAPQMVPGSTEVTYSEEHMRHSRVRVALVAPDGALDPPLELPPYVAADARTLCSAAVHGASMGIRLLYDVAAQRLATEPRAALDGIVTQGAVCAATLQRRNLSAQVVLPTHALDALEAAERWAVPIEKALVALRAVLAANDAHAPTSQPTSSRRDELTTLVREHILCMPGPTAIPSGAPPPGASAFEAAAYNLRSALLGFSAECFRHFPSEAARMALLRATLPCILGDGRWSCDVLSYTHSHTSHGRSDWPTAAQLRHAAIAEVVERAVERWEMLEAVARLVDHVCEAKGVHTAPMDLAAVWSNDAQLFCELVGYSSASRCEILVMTA